MTPWTAIIVNYNGAVFLDACLIALGETRHPPREIILVDNASTDDSLQELYGYPHVDVVALPENRGYAGGANEGLRRVEDPIAVVMNPDVEVDQGFGMNLSQRFDDATVGAAGALLLYPDGRTIQHAGGIISEPHLFTDHVGRGEPLGETFERESEPDFVTGAALALRVDAARQIGGFDEMLVPAYYEDVDLCVRLRDAGWRVVFDPALRGLHHEGVTLEHSDDYYIYLHRNRLRYALKHLSADYWRRTFVPAEFGRIRHEFSTAQDDAWSLAAGVDALNAVMRTSGSPDLPAVETLGMSSWPGPTAEDLDDLHRFRQVSAELPDSKIPGLGLFRRMVMALGLRQYIEHALAQQRAFNDAVVRSFERQRDLNREQTALALLHALVVLRAVHDLAADGNLADDRNLDVATEVDAARPDHAGDEWHEQRER